MSKFLQGHNMLDLQKISFTTSRLCHVIQCKPISSEEEIWLFCTTFGEKGDKETFHSRKNVFPERRKYYFYWKRKELTEVYVGE